MDDVRLRLLALLPLATGAGVLVYRLIVATIPNTPTGTPMAAATLWPPRGFYELHGVEKCAPEPPPPAQLTSPSDRKAGTAVVLPDLTSWTLSYDHWGNVSRVGFPTGGSISYTYAVGPQSCSSLPAVHLEPRRFV